MTWAQCVLPSFQGDARRGVKLACRVWSSGVCQGRSDSVRPQRRPYSPHRQPYRTPDFCQLPLQNRLREATATAQAPYFIDVACLLHVYWLISLGNTAVHTNGAVSDRAVF